MGEQAKSGDKLEAAIQQKEERLTIGERKLVIIKWNLRQSLRLGAKLGQMLSKVFGGVATEKQVASLLQKDIGALVIEHEDVFVDVILETVKRGNFDNDAAAREWVEDLGAAEALRIFAIIARQNIRPLVQALNEVGAAVREVAGKVRREQPLQTSSPS